MTGRGNFTAFANWMDKKFGVKKDPLVWAELLRTNDEYAIHSACWIFAIAKSLIDEAINDDLETIRKRINGGILGMAEVKKYNQLCKQYIV
jgi:putative chitinase